MGLNLWLMENLLCATEIKPVKGEAEVSLEFCTPKRSQEEGLKAKELWLQIKEGRNKNDVKAVYYGLLLCTVT